MKMQKVWKSYTKLLITMQKIVFLSILSFLFSCSVFRKPPLISVTPTEVDLGEINCAENSIRSFEVSIKNIGGEPLYIKSILRDCESCTSVDIEHTSIKPDSVSKVKVSFDGKYFISGPIENTIFINSNAQNMPEVMVNFSADLK